MHIEQSIAVFIQTSLYSEIAMMCRYMFNTQQLMPDTNNTVLVDGPAYECLTHALEVGSMLAMLMVNPLKPTVAIWVQL